MRIRIKNISRLLDIAQASCSRRRAEGARGSAYMLALERESRDAETEITVWGKYEHRLVKTPEGWRSDTWYDSDVTVIPSPFAPLD